MTFAHFNPLIVIFCLIQFREGTCGAFSFQDCADPTTRYASTDRLSLSPDPLLFGRDVFVGGTFTIFRTLPENATVGLELWRTFYALGLFPLDVRMPCLVSADCTINMYHLFRSWPLACDFIKGNMNGTCHEPLTPGRYDGDGFKRHIPEANSVVTLFAAGLYKARVRVWDADTNEELACLFVTEGLYAPESSPAL